MSVAAAISRNPVTRTATAILLVTLGASAWLAYQLDVSRQEVPPQEVLYLKTPSAVKYASLGYTGLAACIYWTRTVQYFGEKNMAKSKRFDLLQPLLDLTVSLDPHLIPAYEFGAIFLAQAPPWGAGMPDAAVAFVERGVKNNPTDWRLYYHLGFIQYMERHDYKAAAAAFMQASNVAGHPVWMNALPALMSQRAGDIETARVLWTRMYEGAENDAMRKNAYLRLVALHVDDDVIHLEALTEAYKKRTGNYPVGWREMIAAGLLKGVPADPSGTAYRLAAEGKVVVEDPGRFPFITKGVPAGQKPPDVMTKETEKLLQNH